jgi:very-short-patch-repair endonuclease
VRRLPGAPTSPCKGEVGRDATGRGSPGRFSRTKGMTSRARALRRRMTEAEKKLWSALRRKQVLGLSFRRQHPIGPYVLDFYCPQIGLAIELDGGQHNEEGRTHDERRTHWLKVQNITVLRFWNNEIFENVDGVLSVLVDRVHELTPSLTLPLSGGGNRPWTP